MGKKILTLVKQRIMIYLVKKIRESKIRLKRPKTTINW